MCSYNVFSSSIYNLTGFKHSELEELKRTYNNAHNTLSIDDIFKEHFNNDESDLRRQQLRIACVRTATLLRQFYNLFLLEIFCDKIK